MHASALSLAAVVFAVAGPVRAQTIVVSGGGGALQQAIATAPVGALLDVMPGSYSPVALTQGVHISLRPGAIVEPPFSPVPPPALTLSALPAGQRFVLEGTGGTVRGLQFIGCAGDIVVNGINHGTTGASAISTCTGAVVFHRTSCVTFSTSVSYGSIAIANCAHVSFTSCQLSPLSISSSSVSLVQCSNQWSQGSVPGVDLQSGRVVVDGGSIEGAALYSFPLPHPGLRIAAGAELTATGGAVIRSSSLYPLPSIAIEGAGGLLRFDASVHLIGSIRGPVAVQYAEIPSLVLSHTPTTMSVALTGEPGSAVFTFAGLLMAPVATPWGEAWLSPLDPLLDVTVVPASGAWTFARTFATVPPLFVLTLQSVALTPSGQLVIGAPTRFAWD